MSTLASLMVKLGIDATDFHRGVGKLEGGAGKLLGTLGKLGAAGAVGAGTALLAVGKLAFEAGQEFDAATDTIVTKTGATGQALAGLQENFKAVFTSIPTDAATASSALAELAARTGATGLPLQEMTKQLLEATRLLGGDATQNAGLFARVMGDWGIPVENGAATLDKLFVVAQQTGVGMDSLMTKMVQFGAPLRLMGFSMDDSAALFGKWEKEGVNAELVMGSLRIAAGKFADAQKDTTQVIKGGVPDMAAATEKLSSLKDQLHLAQMKQGEFTDKTKASTRAASEMRINDLTRKITELTTAMAKGEDRTVKVAGANKTLRESLLKTFDAIRNNADASDALALGMQTFGARAGPDMVAAIREGRFAIDDLTTAMAAADGAISRTAEATADYPEKFQVMKNQLTTLLAPLGLEIMDVVTKLAGIGVELTNGGLAAPGFRTALADLIGDDAATKVQDFLLDLQAIGKEIGTHLPTVLDTGKKFFGSFKKDALDAIADGSRIGNQYLTDLKTSLGITPDVSGWSGVAGFFRDLADKIEAANGKLTTFIERINAALGASEGFGSSLGGVDVGTLNLPGVPGYVPPPQSRQGAYGQSSGSGSAGGPTGAAAPLSSSYGFNIVINAPGGNPRAVEQAAQSGVTTAARAMGLL